VKPETWAAVFSKKCYKQDMDRVWAEKHQLLVYFIMAYVFSWIIGIPLALSVAGKISKLPLSLHYLTAYGPMLSAFLVIYLTKGPQGLKGLFQKIIDWRVGKKWYIFAFSPILLFIIMELLMKNSIDFSALGQVNFLPNLGFLALLLWIFNSGIGEEVGWRGFALPKLQEKHTAIKSSLILSIFWIGWHLPAFFYLPNYMQMGLTIFPMFALGVASGAIVYTWLFNSTKGNILMAILFHGAFNFVTASKAGEGSVAAILSMLVVVLAVVLIILYRNKNLSAARN
jgi:membrane protease YdiL (CAAX protease family)